MNERYHHLTIQSGWRDGAWRKADVFFVHSCHVGSSALTCSAPVHTTPGGSKARQARQGGTPSNPFPSRPAAPAVLPGAVSPLFLRSERRALWNGIRAFTSHSQSAEIERHASGPEIISTLVLNDDYFKHDMARIFPFPHDGQ